MEDSTTSEHELSNKTNTKKMYCRLCKTEENQKKCTVNLILQYNPFKVEYKLNTSVPDLKKCMLYSPH